MSRSDKIKKRSKQPNDLVSNDNFSEIFVVGRYLGKIMTVIIPMQFYFSILRVGYLTS